jgi:hypothetical protein
MIAMQSRLRQAGVTPTKGRVPRVGLNPTMPLNAAGTRPDPAVSVAREKETRPAPTWTTEPEEDPPDIYLGCQTDDADP